MATPQPPPFALRLTRLRERAGLSRTEAALRVGVALSTLYRWERGEAVPRFRQYADLADAYKVNVAALFRGLSAADVRASAPRR